MEPHQPKLLGGEEWPDFVKPIKDYSLVRLRVLVILSLILSAAAQAAPPDSPSLRNARLGFGERFHNRHWTPVRVELDNPGPERHAYVVAELLGATSKQLTTVSCPVWLPANSRRSIEFPVFPDVDEARLSAAKPIGVVLNVKLTDGGLKVWDQQTALAKIVSENARLVLVADSRLTSYHVPPEVAKRPVAAVTIRPDALPSRLVDYDGIDALVLGEPGDQEPTHLQIDAAFAWLRSGGCLIFTPGITRNEVWLAQWDAVLPARYFGPERTATESQFSRWGPAPLFSDGLAVS